MAGCYFIIIHYNCMLTYDSIINNNSIQFNSIILITPFRTTAQIMAFQIQQASYWTNMNRGSYHAGPFWKGHQAKALPPGARLYQGRHLVVITAIFLTSFIMFLQTLNNFGIVQQTSGRLPKFQFQRAI